MIGVWTGDNFGNRKGTVVRKGKRSSGRFGIINNDKQIIKRFLKGLEKELNVKKLISSGKFIRREKSGRAYIYYLP